MACQYLLLRYPDGADHTKISSRQDASVRYPEIENTSYGASTIREPQLLTIPVIAPLLFTKLCFQQAISMRTDLKHCLSHHQHVSDEMSFSADCRYCADTVNDSSLHVSPCKCSGTMQYVHQECLQQDFVINQRKVLYSVSFVSMSLRLSVSLSLCLSDCLLSEVPSLQGSLRRGIQMEEIVPVDFFISCLNERVSKCGHYLLTGDSCHV